MNPPRSTPLRWPLIALLAGLLACGDTSDSPDTNEPDAGSPDAGEAPMEVDISTGDGARVEPTETTPVLVVNEESYTFSRAYFGLTHADATETGRTELYIEVVEGGDEGCPTEESASPDRNMLVQGVYLDEEGEPAAEDAQLIIFDYMGDFVPPEANPPLLRSEGTPQLTLFEAEICESCVGEAQPEGFLKLFVAGDTSEGGVVRGMIEATHCESLDVGPPALPTL
ncbi:hypothetical protein FRC96_06910 [Lujinxingia vulgaris]|uniref:Lipoprotein n=1 Tax=Lujinxingia vulgaris TaxID=2600176 RepID=A0A5C6XCB6_9DELT|nr:hypothetical protein [Lujinxingia vulgaris]TXD39581.1 hypothetical protein FRC96_06910 [Lujinxingia vulgaris]